MSGERNEESLFVETLQNCSNPVTKSEGVLCYGVNKITCKTLWIFVFYSVLKYCKNKNCFYVTDRYSLYFK